jgi:ubiquinone/menaquinone biosynthesis C-methylase UbiE
MRLPIRSGALAAVVSTEAFHWFPDADAALAEFHRVLLPGGTLVLGLVNLRTGAASQAFDAGFRAVGQPAHWPTRRELADRVTRAGFAVEEQRRVVRAFGVVLPTVVTIATA